MEVGKVICVADEAQEFRNKRVMASDFSDFTSSYEGLLIAIDRGHTRYPFSMDNGGNYTFIRPVIACAALEIVKDEYRPFTDEEMKGLYMKTLMDEDGLPCLVTAVGNFGSDFNVHVRGGVMDADELFYSQFTIDGHKCGVKL